MAGFTDDLLFSREHTWVRIDGNIATIGITDYAQEALGEIFSVDLPNMDTYVEQDEPFGTIEAKKTVAELISPISGDIISVNEDLSDDVGIINSDPYNTGWMIVVAMSDSSELDDLLDADEYGDFVEEDEKGR
ncbi:MAG TPA: glycine cleavage system protein GcvH [Deltaproteobacteria bacterium]|nr:glycine cleavage system protein GcvH [Deltaproteobacteria bacterium]